MEVGKPAEAQEVFDLMELEDENQVLAELSGRVTEKYVYEFSGPEGPVTGLSYLGTNWACREYAKHGEAIRIVSKPEIQIDPIDPEYVIVSVVAQRYAINAETGKETPLDSAVGVKRQWTKMKKKDGSIVEDRFAYEKACSKSQRNAKQALIPVDFVKRMIQMALNQKNNPKAAPSARAAQPAKPAAGSAKPAAAPTGDAKPSQKPAGTDPMGALRQKFWTVLKRATGMTKDDDARKVLKDLADVDKVTALGEEALKALGNALGGIIQGTNSFGKDADGNYFIAEKASNSTLYPVPNQEEAPAEDVPPQGTPMF